MYRSAPLLWTSRSDARTSLSYSFTPGSLRSWARSVAGMRIATNAMAKRAGMFLLRRDWQSSSFSLIGWKWSFWTAFEHGFDENELKRAQTRAIWTGIRSITVTIDHNELRLIGFFAIFGPPPPPPPFWGKCIAHWKSRCFCTCRWGS